VRIAGLEPARLTALPPQSSASANSAICARGPIMNQPRPLRARRILLPKLLERILAKWLPPHPSFGHLLPQGGEGITTSASGYSAININRKSIFLSPLAPFGGIGKSGCDYPNGALHSEPIRGNGQRDHSKCRDAGPLQHAAGGEVFDENGREQKARPDHPERRQMIRAGERVRPRARVDSVPGMRQCRGGTRAEHGDDRRCGAKKRKTFHAIEGLGRVRHWPIVSILAEFLQARVFGLRIPAGDA
jgi:hypothetical protein